MPLPTSDVVWPPVSMMAAYAKMNEWAAWYSGEPDRIIAAYATPRPGDAGSVPWWRFWSRARAGVAGNQRALIHVPIAGDLAATSAALLFGEAPTIRVREAREQMDDADEPMMDPTTGLMMDGKTGQPATHSSGVPLTPTLHKMDKAKPKPETPEEKSEARLLQIIEEGDVYTRLIEAAEGAAALGGIYIYPVWDKDLRDFPLMAVAQSDMALPEFTHGILTAVTFHMVLSDTNRSFIRLLERHEVEGTGDSRKAVVLSALYRGSQDRLGTMIQGAGDVMARPPEARIELPFNTLDVEYIPNRLPNRLWRASHMGVADIQGGETFLDALDETYASWMRDIRLAKARILVPREYLRPDSDNANTPTFDVDQEVYVGLDMEPGLAQDARAMLAHQFQIRYKEHQETARDLVDRIVSNAGYSLNTMTSNAAKDTGTGTALRISEHKTLLTLRRKSPRWRTAIANTLFRMQQIDAEIFQSGVKAIRPTVDLSDSIIDNPLELAQTALALKTAESASIETRIRLVHPDWSGPEVDAEVDRIKGETAAAAPVVSPGGFGNPKADPASTQGHPVSDQAKGPTPPNAPPPSPPMAKKQ